MNKVFAEAIKTIDDATMAHKVIIEAKKEELTKYSQLAKDAQEKADQLLFEGDLEGFKKENHEAVEYQTAAEKLQENLEGLQQPIMNEKKAAALEKKINDELGKINDKYSQEIYKHLLEAERLANELYDQMIEGDQADKRFRSEVLHQPRLISVMYQYQPNIKALVSELRKLPYLQRMKGNKLFRWPAQIGKF